MINLTKSSKTKFQKNIIRARYISLIFGVIKLHLTFISSGVKQFDMSAHYVFGGCHNY